MPAHSPRFWDDAHRLRTGEDGAVLCPGFLQPVADAILATGKAARLLRAHGAETDVLPDHAASLQEDTLSNLRRTVQSCLPATSLMRCSALVHVREGATGDIGVPAQVSSMPEAVGKESADAMPEAAAAGGSIADRMKAASAAGSLTALCRMPSSAEPASGDLIGSLEDLRSNLQASTKLPVQGQMPSPAADEDARAETDEAADPAMAAAGLQAWYDGCAHAQSPWAALHGVTNCTGILHVARQPNPCVLRSMLATMRGPTTLLDADGLAKNSSHPAASATLIRAYTGSLIFL